MRFGIDIQNGSSQICYFDEQKNEPVSVAFAPNQYIRKNEIVLGQTNAQGIAVHLTELLSLVQKQLLPKPDKLCITVDSFYRNVLESISEAMKLLGYEKDDWAVLSHEESYAYYAFNQRKELYINGVMLLDYKTDGLHTHYMTIMKKNGLEIIPQESHLYDSTEIIEAAEKKRTLEEIKDTLIACVNESFKDKIMSAVYLTGPGFENGQLPKELTHVICARKKAFAGQNIFVKGACYCAYQMYGRESKEQKKDSQRILACHNRITTGIEFDILERGEMKRFRLVKPGLNWYEAGRSVEFIIEDIRKIPVFLRLCDGSGDYEEVIDISEIPYRDGKMTRIRLDIIFNSDSSCKITVTDLGFGSFVKASGVVIEKEISI